MGRAIPVWFFLFCLLVGSIFSVGFAWAVQTTLAGDQEAGPLGRLAVVVASFPTTARETLEEAFDFATGAYKDSALRVPRGNIDLSRFRPVPTTDGIAIPGLLMDADTRAAAHGWRLLSGTFALNGSTESAALLMTPDLKVVNAWILDERDIGGITPRPKHRKFVHGVALLRDASLIFAFDGGRSLQRLDRCGRRIWAVPGEFHHSVDLDETESSVWTLRDQEIVRVSVADGSIMRSFSIYDVIAANPGIDILELRRAHANDVNGNSRNTSGAWSRSAFHLNDAQPLHSRMAGRFRDAAAGDLLISARSLNLVFVVDPSTLKVKWWRIGATQRQHDPDWEPDGSITVLNNRMSRDYSEIVRIDMASFRKKTLVDGRKYDFYTRIRGNHQVTPSGHVIVASPQQGRAFEVDPTGSLVFEVINLKPGSGDANFAISDMAWFPPDAVHFEEKSCTN